MGSSSMSTASCPPRGASRSRAPLVAVGEAPGPRHRNGVSPTLERGVRPLEWTHARARRHSRSVRRAPTRPRAARSRGRSERKTLDTWNAGRGLPGTAVRRPTGDVAPAPGDRPQSAGRCRKQVEERGLAGPIRADDLERRFGNFEADIGDDEAPPMSSRGCAWRGSEGSCLSDGLGVLYLNG